MATKPEEISSTPLSEDVGRELLARQTSEETSTAGLIYVFASVLIFGIVGVLVQLIDVEPLIMLQMRGSIQWLLALSCVLVKSRRDRRALQAPLPLQGSLRARILDRLLGPSSVRGLVLLRGVLYWTFMGVWWASLEICSVGEATSVVYCAPIFTAIFACCLLPKRDQRFSVPVMVLAIAGVSTIMLPGLAHFATNSLGLLFALADAAVAGLMQVLVGLSRECHWTTVEHVNAFLSSFLLTPLAILCKADRLLSPGHESHASLSSSWHWIVLVSTLEFAGLALQTYGFQRAEVTRASITTMIEVPWSFLLQASFTGYAVKLTDYFGGLFVLLAGILNAIISK
eukprot:TRINITY_DN29363_c0_g1_i1.p1 TRINITY_DN29363_c0_g1~~TRINITY_DN29363_c0_g1_i1.p1  ORF type:complete len:342 (-),score=62.37 TRINITY_DN29363_c0_g1_i1:131-1156(-)